MPQPPQAPLPTDAERSLLRKHLRAFRAAEIRQLMRDNGISGLANNKPHLVDAVEQALRTGAMQWSALIAFLDEHEPNGKQRVIMKSASTADGAAAAYSVSTLHAALIRAGEGAKWNATVQLAAPQNLTLSSVTAVADGVTIVAVGQQHFRVRDPGLEAQVTPPAPNTEVQVYKTETIRAWVRADLNTATGALNLRYVGLPTQKAHSELSQKFQYLIDPWFPWPAFGPLRLHKAVEALYDDERSGTPHEALVQAVVLNDISGLRTSIRGADASQSVIGQAHNLQGAYDVVRSRGSGGSGNFKFLAPTNGGPSSSPIGTDDVRVVINADQARVEFTTPHEKSEIDHVLDRVRVLAT